MRIILSSEAFADPWSLQLFATVEHRNNPTKVDVIHSPQVTTITQDDLTPSDEFKPLLRIDRQDPGLQELMDSLWQLGIRPKDIGTPGHLAATQSHLNDVKELLRTSHDQSVLDRAVLRELAKRNSP